MLLTECGINVSSSLMDCTATYCLIILVFPVAASPITITLTTFSSPELIVFELCWKMFDTILECIWLCSCGF